MSSELLIVGLGNPGRQYAATRHNVGFMAVQAMASQYGLTWSESTKLSCEIACGTVKSRKVFLIKPTTYMNLSGKAVQAVMAYYKIKLENLHVIHDDIDLELGKVKFKTGGGSGGHNGLKSIDQSIGNNYHRARLGVGRPANDSMEVSDYVLAPFARSEQVVIEEAIKSLQQYFIQVLEA